MRLLDRIIFRRQLIAVLCCATLAAAAAPAWAGVSTACVVPDNGTGTVDLPPPGCGYVSPSDLHMMINGLPPGTTIRVDIKHQDFFNATSTPGGSLGGDVENFNSVLFVQMQGTDALSGFQRGVTMTANCVTHTGPRTPGAAEQSFPTDMFGIQGQITGDPDFDLLRITAGTGFGLPSPGHTTLTQLPSGNWNVDSFFDITYRIDFVGHPGGALSGMSGSTTGVLRMRAGRPSPPPCTVADDGSGTVHLPPDGCGYVSPDDLHMMINGLPPGTTIAVDAKHDRFFNKTESPGGSLGGNVETFGSFLELNLHGTGSLGGWNKLANIQIQCQTHTGPRVPGVPLQSFDTDMFGLQGQLPPGDPDFDLLRITAGTAFGMPSPGHTTLTRQSGGDWAVDSFFDITYRIDFVGRPGGSLGGMSGSTTGTIRMQTGSPVSSDAPPAPQVTALHQNSPNPFNPSTRIAFDLGDAGAVTLQVVDVSGRVIRTIVDSLMQPGRYTFVWDGKDGTGNQVASGKYFYTLKAPNHSETKSLVLLK